MKRKTYKPTIYKGRTYMTIEDSEQHKRLAAAADLYRSREYERAQREFDAALSADPC